jgi:hypothetical protein
MTEMKKRTASPLTTTPWWGDPKSIPPRGGDMDDEAEIAAAVIEDLLYLVAPEKRQAALAIATKVEDAEREERKARGSKFKVIMFDEMTGKAFLQSPGMRH